MALRLQGFNCRQGAFSKWKSDILLKADIVMTPSPEAHALETAASQLADHLVAQAAQLRELVQAVVAGEGTIQIARHLKSVEQRRAELQTLFEQASESVS